MTQAGRFENDCYIARRDKLIREIRKNGVQAMLVTEGVNVSYLTGFTGDSSWLLIGPNVCCMLSDTRYQTQLAEQCPGIEIQIRDASGTLLDLFSNSAKSRKLKSVALETAHLSKNTYDELVDGCKSVDFSPSTEWIESLRSVKDKFEIAEICRAIKMAQSAFNVIRQQLTGDQSESLIAHNLEHQIRAFGGDRCAFDPIVAVGPRAALPHAEKSDRKINESPFVLIDWGAKAGQYLCDLTRMLVTGKISTKLQRIYGVVLNAQLAAIDKIRPGASFQEVDKTARQLIADAGFGKSFGHGLGHGFGLQIHESPRLSPIASGEFKVGMVVTVEPGIYIPEWGGVRIEDDVLVTKEGHQVLSSLPKGFDDCVVDCIY